LFVWTDYLREVKTNSRRAYYRTAQAVNTGRPQIVIRIAKVMINSLPQGRNDAIFLT
jgi:hypothetical protein